jgi:F0F1-type ATP synthase delta subunit
VDELVKNSVNPRDKSAVIEFCEKLLKETDSSNLVEITVAVEPTGDMKKAISGWFILNYDNKPVFELRHDPSIIGGALISYKGEFRDYSIRKKLSDHFTKQVR